MTNEIVFFYNTKNTMFFLFVCQSIWRICTRLSKTLLPKTTSLPSLYLTLCRPIWLVIQIVRQDIRSMYCLQPSVLSSNLSSNLVSPFISFYCQRIVAFVVSVFSLWLKIKIMQLRGKLERANLTQFISCATIDYM